MREHVASTLRMAAGVILAFPAVWLGMTSARGVRSAMWNALELARWVPVALACAIPVAVIAAWCYRGYTPAKPTGRLVLWMTPRIFWQAPVMGLVGGFALLLRFAAMLSPRLADRIAVAPRWERGELGRSWVGLPIWVMFLGAPMQSRNDAIEWDHAYMQQRMRRVLPFAVLAVYVIATGATHSVRYALLASLSLGDFLVLERVARTWR